MGFTTNYFCRMMKKNNEYPFYDAIHIWNESKKGDRTAKKLLDYYRKKKRNQKIKKLLAFDSHWKGLS